MKRALLSCIAVWIAPAIVSTGLAVLAAEEPRKEPAAPPAKPPGKLQVENAVVDVGDVVRGQEAKATFVLKNVGTEPLKILSAKPG